MGVLPAPQFQEGNMRSQGGNRLLRRATNRDLAEMEKAELAAIEQEKARDEGISNLASYCDKIWEKHKQAKIKIEREMLEGARRKAGEYEARKKADIDEEGGSSAYFRLTETKCRTAISWILDILFPAQGTRPYQVKPTPIPDINPLERQMILTQIYQAMIQQALAAEAQTGQPINIAQLGQAIKYRIESNDESVSRQVRRLAKRKAKKMEDAIDDLLIEGGFYDAMREFIEDVVSMKAGVLGGPFVRKKRVKSWAKLGMKYVPQVKEEKVVEFNRINPLDVYPAPGAGCIQRGNLVIRHQYVRKDLDELRGVDGYIDANIVAALEEYGMKGTGEYLWTDQEREDLKKNGATFANESFDLAALEFWISAPGSMLMEYGIPGVDDPTREYEVNVIKVGRHVIRAIMNPDVMGRRPYSMAAFIKNPDSVWGCSLPDSIKDDQEAANAVYRALINNAVFCSGPMTEENVERMSTTPDEGLHPYKRYKVTNDQMASGAPAVRFYQPQSVTRELIDVLETISNFADDHSNIPAYAHGNENVGGGGDTASGLSMLMGAASRGIKTVVGNIDVAMEQILERTYDHLMIYSDDQSIKGDSKVVAIGSRSQVIREQMSMRRREMLRDTNNDVDIAIIGLPGRKKLLEQTFKDMELHDVFDDPDIDMPMLNAMNAMNPMQTGMIPGQEPGPESLDLAGNRAGGVDVNAFNNQPAQVTGTQ